MKFKCIMLSVAFLSFTCVAGMAYQVTYTYTGADFTDIHGNPSAAAGDRITASITLLNALQPNSAYYGFSEFTGIQSWSITDGHQLYFGSSAMPDWDFLSLTTGDDASQIVDWIFLAAGDYSGQYLYAFTDYDESWCTDDDFALTAAPGQWTMTTVPEPSFMILLCSGILGLGVTFLRKKTA